MAAPMGAYVYHVKQPHVMTTTTSDSSSEFSSSKDGISAQDKVDMANMGKKQQFKVSLYFLSQVTLADAGVSATSPSCPSSASP